MSTAALLADLILVFHVGFVMFVAFGGLLVLRWPRVAWVHLPAAIWGAGIELTGGICPLTPLENVLRERAGEAGYQGDFVARYLLPVLYPEGLTRDAQLVLGVAVIAANTVLYTLALTRARARRTQLADPRRKL
jgi:hypothetical protein